MVGVFQRLSWRRSAWVRGRIGFIAALLNHRSRRAKSFAARAVAVSIRARLMNFGSFIRHSAWGVLLLASVAFAETPKSTKEQLKQDLARLDGLMKASMKGPPPTFTVFNKEYWLESKRVAAQTGPRIIPAIMERATTWSQGEEGLLFVPLVAFLERKPTLKLLKEYQHSKRESDRIAAKDFLIELADE